MSDCEEGEDRARLRRSANATNPQSVNSTTPLLSDENVNETSLQEEGDLGINQEHEATDGVDVDSHSGSAHPDQSSYRRLASLFLSPLMDEKGNPLSIVMGLFSIALCGTIIGSVMPKAKEFHSVAYSYLSSCLGYTYFFAWSISFYPQAITNYRRKTTQGLSVEFSSLNVLGFACYSAYNVVLFFSSEVQELYKHRYNSEQIPVQSNDVAFVLHALLLSSITLYQILHYDGMARARQMSKTILTMMGLIMAVAVGGAVLVVGGFWGVNWLDYIYALSLCKIVVTLVKYMPQVYLNWKRKSTAGWSIWQILLDLTGGFLSNLQLVLDCAALSDFSGITGNVAKLILGQASIFFDVIFCLQHYVLYPSSPPRSIDTPVQEDSSQEITSPFVEGDALT